MPPNTREQSDETTPTGVLNETDHDVTYEEIQRIQEHNKYPYQPIIWDIVIKHIISHVAALYGLYLACTSASLLTILLVIFNYQIGVLGDTAGAHRLWSHHSYKAKWPLRLFLAYCHTLNFHRDIVLWVSYHRIHHKFTETDADPQNAKRGFVYSHIGWTYREHTKEFQKKLDELDVDDLYRDPIVAFQHKHYMPLMLFTCFILQTIIPMYYWNETFKNAFFLNMLRYIISLHTFLTVNSLTHLYGYKPYNRNLEAVENSFVSYILGGEGWHNFHHTFPWDYRTSEFGDLKGNTSAAFIRLMAKVGLATDLREVSQEMIDSKASRLGDGRRRYRRGTN